MPPYWIRAYLHGCQSAIRCCLLRTVPVSFHPPGFVHGFPDAMAEMPRCGAIAAQLPLELQREPAFFGIYHQRHGSGPLP